MDSIKTGRMSSQVQMGWDYMRNKPRQKSRRKIMKKRRPEDEEINVQGKITIVTGSNSGLGKQAALELAMRGAHIIMACRDIQKAEEARQDIMTIVPIAKIDIMKLDLGDLASIREFARDFQEKYPHLNILVENAGLNLKHIRKTKDGFEMNFGVNYLGHFLLTHFLLDHLKKGAPSRIVCVSSTFLQTAKLNLNDLMMLEKHRVGSSVGFQPYANSKLAQALFVKQLAAKLEGTGVGVYGMCPGMVTTNVTRNDPWYLKGIIRVAIFFSGFSVRKGCETIVYCTVSKNVENENGKMYRFLSPWKKVDTLLDTQKYQMLGQKLWDASEKLVGLPSSSRSQLHLHDDDEVFIDLDD